jgi:hypothetical protein
VTVASSLWGAAPAIGARSRGFIPRELVLALLGVQSRMAGSELLVGKAPASLPAEVLSPDVRVLGGFEGDQQSTTVLVVPARSDEARRQLRERLEKAGWKRPPESARPQRRTRSSTTVLRRHPDGWCRGEQSVMTSSAPRAPGSVTMTVYHMRSGMGGMCAAQARYGTSVDDLPIPALEAPDGFVTEGNGYGGGGPEWSLRATLRGRGSTVDAILRHYTDQLVAAKWSAGDRSARGQRRVAAAALADGRQKWTGSSAWCRPGQRRRGYDVFLNLRKR